MGSDDQEIAILRATVAALRATRRQATPLPVRPRWHFLAAAFVLGFATGATLIALTR